MAKEWTWKVQDLADEKDEKSDSRNGKALSCRVEGPYVPATLGYQSADHVICFVGGTGLTGAYSLALWWLEFRKQEPKARFTLLWMVRDRKTTELEEWRMLLERTSCVENMMIIVHVSSEKGRLNISKWLTDNLSTDKAEDEGMNGKAWAYGSGPEGLLSVVEDECISMAMKTRRSATKPGSGLLVNELDFYIAKWEV